MDGRLVGYRITGAGVSSSVCSIPKVQRGTRSDTMTAKSMRNNDPSHNPAGGGVREMFRPRMLRALLLFSVLFGAVLTTAAEAQYFGRNKVRHRSFKFQILKTEHFDIHYYEEERAAAEVVGRMSERWYARLSRVLGHELGQRQTIILYASHPHFEQTNAISGELDESTGGVTESVKRRVVLPMAATMTDSDHVLGHELVHAFQYDITGRTGQTPIALRLPLWFIEGMAEYLSLGPTDAHTAMWMRDAAVASDLPDFTKLEDFRYFPYRYGHAFWAYVAGRFGDAAVPTLLKNAGMLDLRMVYGATLGIDPDSLIMDWKRFLKDNAMTRKTSAMPSAAARRVLGSPRSDRKLYLAPSLSPNGREVAFLSERDFYTIDLYVADAVTGRVLRKLTKTSVDPHYQSLQFTGSSGSWSPDGRRFAFGAVHEGQAILSIIDAKSGRRTERYSSKDLGEVLNSSWSPDGRKIVFSALTGGQTDLFMVTIGSPVVRRLTNDLYGDLQPAWSPDGSRIAFVTERYTGNLDSLAFHRPSLAILDVGSGEITPLPSIGDGKHLSPQWSPDGRSLYLVSDPDGVSNLYILDLETGTHRQLTDLMTGVSGLTALSPTLSVARNGSRLAFSAYENGSFGVFALDSLDRLSEKPESEGLHADLLAPPFERDVARWTLPDSMRSPRDPFGNQPYPPQGFDPRTGERIDPDSLHVPPYRAPVVDSTRAGIPPGPRPSIASLLQDPRLGLPDTTGFSYAPYKARLSLDRISQIDLGVGAVGSHFAASGGASVYWSDMLGNHHMLTFLQIQGEQGSIARSLAAGLAYYNMRGRQDWGLQVSQVPYLSREFQVTSVPVPPGNEPGFEERENRLWQTERTALGTISYPISRVQRWEMALGFQNIDFQGESIVRIYDGSGRLLTEYTTDLPGQRSLNLGIGSAAWVYDTGVFGGTSPIMGQRARLEASPVVGSLSYTSFLTDIRQYVMPLRPITLAGRFMHYGRYGPDSEDPLLIPLYLGAPYLVRGYDDASFTVAECVDQDCLAYNQLFGSKLAVANAELRFPLLGPFGMLRTPLLPPVEVAGFFDAGTAWTEDNKAQFLGGTRNVVTSQGIAMRFSLFGYFIAELDYVMPNDRPLKDPYWVFTFQPGF